MRYLRHFPLTLWLAVAVVLAGIVGIALMRQDPAPLPAYAAQDIASERPMALAALQKASGVYPAMAGGGVAAWATGFAADLDAALKAHVDGGGTAQDPLGVAWSNAKVAAINLAVASPADRHVRAAELGTAVQYVVAVVDGIALAPAAPATLDPAAVSGGKGSGGKKKDGNADDKESAK